MSHPTFSDDDALIDRGKPVGAPLRVLIVKPRPPRQHIRADRLMRSEPLELEYLATVLADHEVTLLDGIIDRRDPLAVARHWRPDVVLFSAYITDITAVLATAARLKRLARPPLVFVGGVHAEVMPQHFDHEAIDGVFFANQLAGIAATLEHVRRGTAYWDTPGAAFRRHGALASNPSDIVGLQALPRPERILFERNPAAYRYLHYRSCATVKTSFGCPCRCTFCFCRLMNGGAYTTREIDDVLDEIAGLSAARTIFLVDDNLLVDPNRLRAFCDGVQSRGLRKEFIAYGTAHFIARHPEMMRRLREAGLRGVIVGFEYITDTELSEVKKTASSADNDATVAICRELDIDLFALFIVNPRWGAADFRQLAAYLKSREITFATFSTLTPFPGVGLAEGVEREEPWWRYDLLRLHEQPARMSRLSYYLWLNYLYLSPGLHIATLRRLVRRCGVWGTLRLLAASTLTGIEYLVKLFIWR